jgi:hypothetical protein
MVVLVTLVLKGAGLLSVDRLLINRRCAGLFPSGLPAAMARMPPKPANPMGNIAKPEGCVKQAAPNSNPMPPHNARVIYLPWPLPAMYNSRNWRIE